MSGKQALIAILAVTMGGLGVSASAQDRGVDRANQLTGSIGRIFISDQGLSGPNAPAINPFIRSGNGLTFQVNYSRFLLGNSVYGISAELPAAFNLDEKLNSGADVVPKSYQQIFVTPAFRLNLFPETAVSPWVSVGGGFAHFSENSNLNYYGPNPGSSTTSGVFEGGIGLDVNPFQGRFTRFGFRLDARDFWSGEPDFPLADTGKTRQHNYFVGGGVIWHF
jgi:hypothetical protein